MWSIRRRRGGNRAPVSGIRGQRRISRVLVGCLVASWWSVALPTLAGAATTVTVDVPDTATIPGVVVSINISVKADELVDGHVELVAGNNWDNQGTAYTADLELAAGARKTLKIPVIVPFMGMNEVRVRVFDGDDEVAQVSQDLGDDFAIPQVAVLRSGSDQTPLPETVATDFDLRPAAVRSIDADASISPGALGGGSVVISDAKSLRSLDEDSARTLGAWVRSGGTLRIAGNNPDLAPLGMEWSPDQTGVMVIQSGRVETVDSVVAALNIPFKPGALMLPNGSPAGPEVLARDLAESAGFAPVEVRFIGGFLLGYVLIAGPLLFGFTALIRRRRLIWIALPLTALLATGAAVQLTKQQRAEQGMSHSTVLNLDGSRSYVTTALGISSPTGNASVLLPQGFAAGNGSSDARGVEVAVTADGPKVQTLGGVGSFTVASAIGAAVSPGDVLVDVVREASTVTGTVTNEMPWTLHDCAIQVGDAMAALGDIEPGQTVDVSVDLRQQADLFAEASQVWPNIANLVMSGESLPSDEQNGVTGGLIVQLLSQPQAGGRSDTNAAFLGFTGEFEDPLGDGRLLPGHTLVAKSLAVPLAASLDPADRAVLPTHIELMAFGDQDSRNVIRAHFDDPEAARQEAEAGRLAVEGPTSLPREYWNGESWVTLQRQDGGNVATLEVPDDLEVDDLNGDGLPDDIDGDGLIDDLNGDGIIDLDGDGIADIPVGVPLDQGMQTALRHLIPPEAIDDNGDVVLRLEPYYGSMLSGAVVRFTPPDQLDLPPTLPAGQNGFGVMMDGPLPVGTAAPPLPPPSTLDEGSDTTAVTDEPEDSTPLTTAEEAGVE